ncbi:MAG: SRPBCC family protein [Sandaracinus sp.]
MRFLPRAALAGAFFASSLSFWGVASAQDEPTREADRALATFTPAEIALLQPLLDTGVVSLVEFAYGDQIPAIVIACEIEAPADVVAAVIGEPAHYPEFMPALDSVEVTSAEGDSQSYDWSWHTSIFTLHGQNTMVRYAPPADQPARGYRFVVRSEGGDLGTGRTVWRVIPQGASRSLVMTSSRMDLRDANYIARQLAAASSTMNRSIHVALAFSMMLRTRTEAEHRASFHRDRVVLPEGDPVEPTFDPTTYENLLLRGDLMWVETSDGSDQGRVVGLGRIHTDEARTRAAILDPYGFTQGLLQGAHATMLPSDDGTRFEWGIDLPLVGTTGVMHMREQPDGILALDAESGALNGARWRFRTRTRDYGTLLTAWGRFDLGDGLWLVRVVQDADPAFRPGLSSSAELMMVRGLRTRLSM